jgi:uncharacterized protein YdaU (DUF1376 family)
LAYRRLLDQYYLREGPLPADIAATAKLVRMRSMQADVESVLREFFELTEEGWRHKRCDEEVAHMQDKQAKARASAAASVEARRAKAERTLAKQPTDAERTLPIEEANVELPTPTPTPTPIKEKNPSGSSRATRLPTSWDPGSTGLAFAESQGLTNGVVTAELGKFRDYWAAKAGRDAVKADWDATWRNWCRRVADLRPHERAAPAATQAAEPAWRCEQRERTEAFAGPAAARRHKGNVIDMEAISATARILG